MIIIMIHWIGVNSPAEFNDQLYSMQKIENQMEWSQANQQKMVRINVNLHEK